jgi:hypothetical protein
LSQVLPKFEPFDSGSITFFQIQELLDSAFEPGPVPCTHYSFPNAERLCEYKVLRQIKIGVKHN